MPPIIERTTYDAAQERKRHNRLVRRQQPTRFYLLSGMVFCLDCGKPYVAQTSKIGRGEQKTEHKTYRERGDKGGCRNQQVAANYLEPAVWEKVHKIVLDPQLLETGYEEALHQRTTIRSKLQERINRLEADAERIQGKLNNLMDAYLDPVIGMRKTEYINHKDRLEAEKAAIRERIRAADAEISRATPPIELESLERFAAEIKEIFESDIELTPREKRKALELLDARVLIDGERNVRIEGMFGRAPNGLIARTS